MPIQLIRRAGIFSLVLFAAAPFLAEAQPAGRVIELFQKAQQAEQSADYAKAAGLYREIVALDPQIAEVWSNLGMALYHSRKDSEAVSAFQRAAALKPSLLAPHLFEGEAYLDMGNAQKAIVPLKTALAMAPGQLETILALSDAYAAEHQFAASIHMLLNAEKQSPESEDIGCRLAVTYLEWATSIGAGLRDSPTLYGRILSDEKLAAEAPERAEPEFLKTVDSAPDSIEARLALANFLMRNPSSAVDLQASAEQINAASKRMPGNEDVLAARVRLAIAEKDYSLAVEKLKVLLATDQPYVLTNLNTLTAGLLPDLKQQISSQAQMPASPRAATAESYSSRMLVLEQIKSRRRLTEPEAVEYASAAWHLHEYDRALSSLIEQPHQSAAAQYWEFRACVSLGEMSLERTVDAHPESVRSHLLLADLAVQQNNFTTAQTEYQAAVALQPDNAEIRLPYIRFLEIAHELPQALAEAKQDAARFPTNAELNFQAGDLTLLSQGDTASAIQYLLRSIQEDPKPVKPHVDLADAYAQLNRIGDAIREINLVLSADDDGTMHYRLARWYRETGHPDEAGKALEACEKIKQEKLEREQNFVSKLMQKEK